MPLILCTQSPGGTDTEIQTASGSIANFESNLSVPLKSSKFNITPTQASGTPTPSNPLPITGWTGTNVVQTGANLYNPNSEIVPHSTYGFFNLCPDNTELSIQLFDKDNTVSLSGISFGFSKGMTENGAQSEVNVGYNWIVQGGTDTGSRTNIRVVTCDQFFFYPKTQATLDTINARYYINIVVGSTVPTAFEEYTATTYPVSWSEHGTIYGGYFKDGELWKTHEIIDLGSLNWTYRTDVLAVPCFLSSDISDIKNGSLPIACSCLEIKSPNRTAINGNYQVSIGNNTNAKYLVIRYDEYSDGATVKTALTGQTLAYELATPVKVADIDPLELVSMLGVNNIWSDTGDCEVEYRADPTLATQ